MKVYLPILVILFHLKCIPNSNLLIRVFFMTVSIEDRILFSFYFVNKRICLYIWFYNCLVIYNLLCNHIFIYFLEHNCSLQIWWTLLNLGSETFTQTGQSSPEQRNLQLNRAVFLWTGIQDGSRSTDQASNTFYRP